MYMYVCMLSMLVSCSLEEGIVYGFTMLVACSLEECIVYGVMYMCIFMYMYTSGVYTSKVLVCTGALCTV